MVNMTNVLLVVVMVTMVFTFL